MKIKTLIQTCAACPSQWEGKLESGEDIYIRYRWGVLRIDINGQTVHKEFLGDDLDGYLSTEELKQHLSKFEE